MKHIAILSATCIFIISLISTNSTAFLLQSKRIKKEAFKNGSAAISSESSNKRKIKILLKAYPNHLIYADSNSIIWKDGTKMVFDDSVKNKNFDQLLSKPDLEDQLLMTYPISNKNFVSKINSDPGRIRYEPFFKKMYGDNQNKVKKSLVPIKWLPSTINKTYYITSINGIDKKLQAVSNELDTMKSVHKYINNPAGTYNWRYILNTNRLSVHSFGIAIDININYANYWEWDLKRNGQLAFKNKIPISIIKVFEKNGFIWGGKWYHYDTMHFEYRPELLIYN